MGCSERTAKGETYSYKGSLTKRERSQTNNPTLQLKKLEKEELNSELAEGGKQQRSE